MLRVTMGLPKPTKFKELPPRLRSCESQVPPKKGFRVKPFHSGTLKRLG